MKIQFFAYLVALLPFIACNTDVKTAELASITSENFDVTTLDTDGDFKTDVVVNNSELNHGYCRMKDSTVVVAGRNSDGEVVAIIPVGKRAELTRNDSSLIHDTAGETTRYAKLIAYEHRAPVVFVDFLDGKGGSVTPINYSPTYSEAIALRKARLVAIWFNEDGEPVRVKACQ